MLICQLDFNLSLQKQLIVYLKRTKIISSLTLFEFLGGSKKYRRTKTRQVSSRESTIIVNKSLYTDLEIDKS